MRTYIYEFCATFKAHTQVETIWAIEQRTHRFAHSALCCCCFGRAYIARKECSNTHRERKRLHTEHRISWLTNVRYTRTDYSAIRCDIHLYRFPHINTMNEWKKEETLSCFYAKIWTTVTAQKSEAISNKEKNATPTTQSIDVQIHKWAREKEREKVLLAARQQYTQMMIRFFLLSFHFDSFAFFVVTYEKSHLSNVRIFCAAKMKEMMIYGSSNDNNLAYCQRARAILIIWNLWQSQWWWCFHPYADLHYVGWA